MTTPAPAPNPAPVSRFPAPDPASLPEAIRDLSNRIASLSAMRANREFSAMGRGQQRPARFAHRSVLE